MVSVSADVRFQNAVLLTYRSFLSSGDLLRLLIHRYSTRPSNKPISSPSESIGCLDRFMYVPMPVTMTAPTEDWRQSKQAPIRLRFGFLFAGNRQNVND